ncbi:MAG: hypothetical protein NZM25_06620 [Leptospiraceae bacterium]|nr:hypothetical protein [Leptospiraceae bacterium]MDW8306551.1 hypothetical protein [Leptospiraceae bacterium]
MIHIISRIRWTTIHPVKKVFTNLVGAREKSISLLLRPGIDLPQTVVLFPWISLPNYFPLFDESFGEQPLARNATLLYYDVGVKHAPY